MRIASRYPSSRPQRATGRSTPPPASINPTQAITSPPRSTAMRHALFVEFLHLAHPHNRFIDPAGNGVKPVQPLDFFTPPAGVR
ncbi:MAG: hypothetical protein WDN28_28020 [Chthoniobacter sp.]